MNIKFQDSYNALGPFEWPDIPNFVVVMGRNGVGKTQLLNLIDVSINQYDPRGSGAPMTAAIEAGAPGPQRSLYMAEWHISEPQVIGDSEKEQMMQQYVEQYKNHMRGAYYGSLGKKLSDEYTQLRQQGLSLDTPFEAFREHISEKFYLDEQNLLTYRLGYVFREYNTKRGAMALRFFDDPDVDRSTIEDEFIANNGQPPWDIFNSMMATAGLSFHVKPPATLDKEPICLYDDQDRVLHWARLSSGEKVLTQLACWLLYKSISAASFPTVLLLDEPDASLHPAMIRNLISILQDSIVRDMGIRVIMTTHSPTTAALIPASSLYELRKNPTTIAHITKEKALEILGDGLVMVGVNTKYVFVEGPDDPDFYERQYTADLKMQAIDRYPSLAFTPVSVAGPGGVEELKKTVGRLAATSLGSRVRGIIDFDSGNEGDDNVAVLSRYAIENYIFDPLVISLALIYQNKHSLLLSANSVKPGDYMAILHNQALAQQVIDEVCEKLVSNADITLTARRDAVPVAVNFGNGERLEYVLPRWYMEISKDDLRSKILYNTNSPLKDLVTKRDCLLVMDVASLVHGDVHDIFARLLSQD